MKCYDMMKQAGQIKSTIFRYNIFNFRGKVYYSVASTMNF